MVDSSGMLFIVGHIWRSWEAKLFETITKSKAFLNQCHNFFLEQIFRSLLRLFWHHIFWCHYWDFFEMKIFETVTETFFETKIFETDTETFFDTKYFQDRYRDFFFETNIFETETNTFKKLRKVSIPRSLETRCHTLQQTGQAIGRHSLTLEALLGTGTARLTGAPSINPCWNNIFTYLDKSTFQYYSNTPSSTGELFLYGNKCFLEGGETLDRRYYHPNITKNTTKWVTF